jgi:hypothetical protein
LIGSSTSTRDRAFPGARLDARHAARIGSIAMTTEKDTPALVA